MVTTDFEQRLVNLIQLVNATITKIQMYFDDHPEVLTHVESAFAEINRLLKIKPDLTLIVYNNRLVVDQKPITSDAAHLTYFINLLTEKGIEFIRFRAGLTRKEFLAWLTGLSGSGASTMPNGKTLKFGKIKPGPRRADSADSYKIAGREDHVRDLAIDKQMKRVVNIYGNIKQSKSFDPLTLSDLAHAFTGYIKSSANPLKLLVSIRNMDEYTFTHVINVCILTVSQGESLGFSGQQLHEIGIASLLHDMGKLFIPDETLNKAGKLTSEEWRMMRLHPVRGAMQIMKLKDVPKIAILSALEHHIGYNGSGYPQIKKEYKPNIVSQMIAIADAYDALCSNRPYQLGVSPKQAINILKRDKGTVLNPTLFDNFLQLAAISSP